MPAVLQGDAWDEGAYHMMVVVVMIPAHGRLVRL